VIDPDGVIEAVWRKVKARGHADLVRDHLAS
jgi:peroxiredoxin